jgi:hypothetical protein
MKLEPDDVVLPLSYRIEMVGQIDPEWSAVLAGLSISTVQDPGGRILTILSGVLPDQASLRGVLTTLWDMNLILRSIFVIGSEYNEQIGGHHG